MKILICDDHALFRAGLRHVLRDLEDSTELLDAASAEQTFRLVDEHPDLDLILMDLGMPGMDGLRALATLRERHPTLPVVIVSASERNADVRAAIDQGASGFIPKSSTAPVLLAALRLILSGGLYVPPVVLGAGADQAPSPTRAAATRTDRAAALTPRQLEVLELLAKGSTNRAICEALGIAEGTVKAHIATIFDTLGVDNRTAAAAALHELDLSSASTPHGGDQESEGEGFFRQEGEYWNIGYRGRTCLLRDTKGLHYLAYLLRRPGRECHALEIAAEPGGAGARGRGTPQTQEELELLACEMTESIRLRGSGRDDRDATSAAERARQNVSRAVRSGLEKIGENHPELARHLERTVTTGLVCCYRPDPRSPIRWSF